ncbi:hypothetical protein [Paenibacillus sp. Soil724D2]|nr:hypothetical protein [Paenibacillus sp. Soil724D2]
MNSNQVIWPEPIVEKLRSFRSQHFTPEETYDFIVHNSNPKGGVIDESES